MQTQLLLIAGLLAVLFLFHLNTVQSSELDNSDETSEESADSDQRFVSDLGKRLSSAKFASGLGKRLASSKFASGLGKRLSSSKFASGLGKRLSAAKFSSGLGK